MTTLQDTVKDNHSREELMKLWEEHDNFFGKGIPPGVQEILNNAFSKVPVSSFPDLPSGEVVEVSADDSIADTVKILSKNHIMSAPVRNPNADSNDPWSTRYIGMVDYPAVVLWVLEQAELAATALAAGTAAAVGVGAGAAGALGALVLGMTGPAAIAGLAAAAVGAAIAGGVAAEKGVGKDAQTAANALGEDFYKVILEEEPFKSITVEEITNSYRWAPFLPIQPDDSMLTVLLLLSKFRLRSIPIVEADKPRVENVITQSAVVRGLAQCHGRDWFDCIANKTLAQLGLPKMSADQVVYVEGDKLILEAFILMRESGVGGLPVVEGAERKVVGSITVRDVRYLLLKPQIFARRKELTVMDFMNIADSLGKQDDNTAKFFPPLTCKTSATLIEVINSLARENAHRIYLVDDGSSISGVISIRDIISCFVSEPEGYFEKYFGGAFQDAIEAKK
ncbi:hypothetical protein MPTK1_7g15460 [Marchantia polymorpha subsp. ruderalis]|uniref:CBS domain-containing protein n=2 Tax=Marchantia polymorpha TaxID=3197 RepID=A0A176W4Y9_MARPO|nr:hypothetical protein AXG93_59s1100 [Marchantia polymorpha subsp. ruderalis]PTQ47178.1 hypothetical protein MARPO_0009s0230 [Marchantia polymorpha]BBN17572.1 hypothetical protein Mp_7g15460 [Marchantia polymorpha subsp. ruderalis]|eukprot:PTQ47178.1 hypothetical protein MARPO_0009s0230 [Marchantia polymorpha]